MVLCVFAIFSLIPFGVKIQDYISSKLGKSFFIYLVLAILAFALAYLVYYLINNLKIRAYSNYVWLLFIVAGYLYFTLKMKNSPVEATHFLEYGILSFFLFKSLNYHIKDKTIYFSAICCILLIGTLDEVIQWIIPERVWNFRDIGLNLLSGGLVQLAIWKVVGPKDILGKMNPKSLRISTFLFASCVIILGLCASNTPKRVHSYTNKIPWLSFLQKENPMSEFGYKYKDPEIGVFFSRMSPINLKKIDSQEGDEYAQILNKAATMDYGQFLKIYNPITDPFLHEMRVHIFRRNQYYKKAKNTSDLNEKKKFYFISYKENLILEKHYRRSIENSIYMWDNDKEKIFEISVNKNKLYRSPVSSNLFTSFSEKSMWISILAFLSFLALANLILPIMKRPKLDNR